MYSCNVNNKVSDNIYLPNITFVTHFKLDDTTALYYHATFHCDGSFCTLVIRNATQTTLF